MDFGSNCDNSDLRWLDEGDADLSEKNVGKILMVDQFGAGACDTLL